MNNKAVKHPIVTSGAGTAYPSGTPELSPVIVKHPIVTSGAGTANSSGTPEFSPVIVKRSIVTFLGSQILLNNKPLKKH